MLPDLKIAQQTELAPITEIALKADRILSGRISI
jgi:hypothetical protein